MSRIVLKIIIKYSSWSYCCKAKSRGKTIADGFADVTVMFADIVNFTKLSEELALAKWLLC